jgi:hypothetical protein
LRLKRSKIASRTASNAAGHRFLSKKRDFQVLNMPLDQWIQAQAAIYLIADFLAAMNINSKNRHANQALLPS